MIVEEEVDMEEEDVKPRFPNVKWIDRFTYVFYDEYDIMYIVDIRDMVIKHDPEL